jgi:HSP20 family protein
MAIPAIKSGHSRGKIHSPCNPRTPKSRLHRCCKLRPMRRREVDDWFWHVGNELQRINDELTRTRPLVATGRAWEPRVDVTEDSSRLLIKAEIAGVRGEDIQIDYIPDRHSLVIRGIRAEEESACADRKGIYQLEIYYGEFQREIQLPSVPIEVDGIRAQYRNGFLLVMIPKREHVVVTETITITKI